MDKDTSLSSSRAEKWVQLFFGTFLLFLTGSFYSLSVFSVSVEEASPIPGGLDNAWSSAMALMGFTAMPFMILAGLALNNGIISDSTYHHPFGKSKTDRLRVISLFSASCVCTMFLAGPAIRSANSLLISAVVMTQGIPFNLFFLICLEMLAAWTPERPGLAVGCGQMAFGFGSIFFAELYANLVLKFGCVYAINVSSGIMFLIMMVVSVGLKWPPAFPSYDPDSEAQLSATPRREVIPIQKLLRMFAFWLYVFATMSTQLGFGFVAYYFKIGVLFGEPMAQVVKAYDFMFLCTTLARPLMGSLTDSLKWGKRYFSIASKNLNILILMVQALGYLILVPLSRNGSYSGFVIVSSIIFLSFGAGECVAPVLARDIFSPTNSSLVFGVGGSIAFGLGEYLGVTLMSVMSPKDPVQKHPSMYNSYYLLAFLFSICGAGSALLISRHNGNQVAKDAIQQPLLAYDEEETEEDAKPKHCST